MVGLRALAAATFSLAVAACSVGAAGGVPGDADARRSDSGASMSGGTAAIAPTRPPRSAAVSPSAPATAAPPVASAPIVVPNTVGHGERRPFVLFLHGFGASGKILVDNLPIAALAEERRFAYAAPDGALDAKGRRFWNASRACCDLDGAGVPHVEGLGRLLSAAAAHPAVDPRRIFVVGLSNGGFMWSSSRARSC
jgi:polyhydroxybutyrate depolymerase